MPMDFCSFSVKLFREEKKKDQERRARAEAEVDEMEREPGSRVQAGWRGVEEVEGGLPG